MQLDALIDRLAAFEPTEHPFVSLYLDARPDQHGRARFDAFVRKELPARARTYPERSPQRRSVDRDIDRILAWLEGEARASANGIAIFACHGAAEFFQAVQLETPLEVSELHLGPRPYVYPLARVNDRYPRYAVVVTDTHAARIFVFGLGEMEMAGDITSDKMRRSDGGGWSQARFQRHVEKFHAQHVKEVVEALERLVREEDIERVVLAGDEVVMPLIRAQLGKALEARVVDILKMDARAPEREIVQSTLAAMRERDDADDAEKVRGAVDAYRAGGLGVAGLEETRAALANGQVHELLLSASPDTLEVGAERAGAEVADELVTQARQTSTQVTFIEDPALLADVGGVAALLRYRIGRRAA